MSGKAIIVLVAGVIIITSMIMVNIEAASTKLVRNYGEYYMRQYNQNLAQSGVNLAMCRLGEDRTWRAGFADLRLGDGAVNVAVYDGVFDGIPVIVVRSAAGTDWGNREFRRDTSTAYLFRQKKQYPVPVRALLTINANSNANGGMTIDGRDHDMAGSLIAASGVPGVWTTASSFTITSSAVKIGGTDMLADYPPSNPYAPPVVKLNQVSPGGFPQTPDSLFGGADSAFPEGTLKAIAQSGYSGSQYVTDPAALKYPLTGVTYVDLPPASNIWNSAVISGEGILIVHNSAGNAILMNSSGKFKGLVVADDIVHLHGEVLGGVVAFRSTLSGNVVGNGNAVLRFSRKAIVEGAKFLEWEGKPNVLAWWE